MRKLIVVLVLVSQVVFGQELPKANQLVLEYAQKNVGKRVGNGVCRTLTNRALRHKDEVLRPEKSKVLEYSIGNTGKKVEIENALPGDVITLTGTVILYEDGIIYRAVAHIGIVKSIENGIVTYFEQNVLTDKQITIIQSKVVESSFKTKNIISGSIRFYRPK